MHVALFTLVARVAAQPDLRPITLYMKHQDIDELGRKIS